MGNCCSTSERKSSLKKGRYPFKWLIVAISLISLLLMPGMGVPAWGALSSCPDDDEVTHVQVVVGKFLVTAIQLVEMQGENVENRLVVAVVLRKRQQKVLVNGVPIRALQTVVG